MKLSVIIPLYNAEKYIARCIESLLCQTMTDMEIIVVDDHGKDDSVGVVNGIIASHPLGHNIKLIATEYNSGAWAARNLGICNATGEWIGFFDADDFCEPDMYANLISAGEAVNADFAYCLAQKEYSNGKKVILKQPEIQNNTLRFETKKLHLTRGTACFWAGIYHRSFLMENNIRFPKSKFSEDSYFWYKTIIKAERIAAVDKVGYHYIIHPQSVSSLPDPTKARQKQDVYSLLFNELKDSGIYNTYRQELDYLYIKKGFLIPLIITAINDEKPDFKPFFSEIQRQGINIPSNKYYSKDLKSKTLYNLFRHCPHLTSWLLKRIYPHDPF